MLRIQLIKHKKSIRFFFLTWKISQLPNTNTGTKSNTSFHSSFPPLKLVASVFLHIVFLPQAFSLTHAGDDAVHRQSGRGVIEAGDGMTFAVLLFLFEYEGGVLLLGDVDVVAGVSSSHDVAGSRVQEDALVVFPLHSD